MSAGGAGLRQQGRHIFSGDKRGAGGDENYGVPRRRGRGLVIEEGACWICWGTGICTSRQRRALLQGAVKAEESSLDFIVQEARSHEKDNETDLERKHLGSRRG